MFKRNGFLFWLLVALLTLSLISCMVPEAGVATAVQTTLPAIDVPADVPSRAAGMINPGDVVDGVEITTAGTWHWDNNLYSLCIEGDERNEAIWEDEGGDETIHEAEYPCELFEGVQVILNCSGVDERPGEEIDENWSKLTTEILFSDRPINLEAFGSLDFAADRRMRIWNVMLKNMTPGRYTLYCASVYEDETWVDTYNFNVSERPLIEAPPDAQEMLFHGESEMFRTLDDFFVRLKTAVETDRLSSFWAAVDIVGQSPLIFGDYAVFLYRGEGDNVVWEGNDFQEPYVRLGASDMWMMIKQFDADATLEYKVSVDGEEIFDLLNPLRIEAFTDTSVLRMPDYIYPQESDRREDVAYGDLTDNILISSEQLGYDKFYRVYTPAGYETMEALPVIYVNNGTDAINEEYLGMVNVLDNLIADGRIRPIIAIFIDPHNAATNEYVSAQELTPAGPGSCPFCDFVVEELLPVIDADYRTAANADGRALLGMTTGGMWAAYMGLTYPDLFHLIAILSLPGHTESWILDGFRDAEALPLRFFLRHGTYEKNSDAPELAAILREKGAPLEYVETHSGWGYGSWRATTDDALITFFGEEWKLARGVMQLAVSSGP